MCSLINVLKAAPAADVINDDRIEDGFAGLNVGNQSLQSRASFDIQATASFVNVLLDDMETVLGCITPNLGLLMVR